MKIIKLSLLCLAFASIATNSNALTSAQIRERAAEEARGEEERAKKEARKKAWSDITTKIGLAKERFEGLLQLAKQPSAKLAEKIKKIKDKRERKLKELSEKRVSKKMRWVEYSKDKREIIEDYEEDMLEFDEVEEKATVPILRFKLAQQMKRIVRHAVLGEEAKMDAEFTELEKLELEMRNDIAQGTGEWSNARPVGSDVEKKLDFMRASFLGGLTKNYKTVPPEKVKELEKVKNDHIKEIQEIEKQKFTLKRSINKWKINRRYKKKYDELAEKKDLEPFFLLMTWEEQAGELFRLWGENDKKSYNKVLLTLKNLVEETNKKK